MPYLARHGHAIIQKFRGGGLPRLPGQTQYRGELPTNPWHRSHRLRGCSYLLGFACCVIRLACLLDLEDCVAVRVHCHLVPDRVLSGARREQLKTLTLHVEAGHHPKAAVLFGLADRRFDLFNLDQAEEVRLASSGSARSLFAVGAVNSADVLSGRSGHVDCVMFHIQAKKSAV